MVDLRTLEALLRFDPLPEDVKRRMIRLDDGDGVLDPFKKDDPPVMQKVRGGQSVPKVGPDFNGQ